MDRRAIPGALALSLGAAVGLIALGSCTGGPTAQVTRSFTSTIAVGSERTLIVDTSLGTRIDAFPNQRNVLATIELISTASTSTNAQKNADLVKLTPSRDAGQLILTLELPPEALIEGGMTLRIPSYLDVKLLQRTGPADINSVGGSLEVEGGTSVVVVDAQRDVRVHTNTANLSVDTPLLGSATVDLHVTTGDIELLVPEALNADIQAQVETQGDVRPLHSRLPAVVTGAGQTYRTSVGGGGNIVRLFTGTGHIVIRQRN